MGIQRLNDPPVARDWCGFNRRRNKVRSIHDVPCSVPLSPLDILSQGIITFGQSPIHFLSWAGASTSGIRGQQVVDLIVLEIFQARLLDIEELDIASLHFLLVTQCVVTQHQMKPGHEIEMFTIVHQQVFIAVDCIGKLMHLEKRMPNVPHDLEPMGLHIVGNLIQSHAVHFDSSEVLPLVEIHVTHIDPKTARVGILLVLHNLVVDDEGLLVATVGLTMDCQIQANGKCEVDVELLQQVVLLAKAIQLSLLLSCLLRLFQRVGDVPSFTCYCGLFHQFVDLLLKIPELVLR
mmetsp:Transcript_22884/g.50234  ORF Transcript_22884/g.50234 Transcript_22884/m.50234 type:complete len:292 (+) Transcript_22884:1255-2130(+)